MKLLEYVHEAGYIHNDLKPDNIMIGVADTSDDSSDVKIIDFGLASQYIDEDGNHTK